MRAIWPGPARTATTQRSVSRRYGEGFAGYAKAREERISRLEERRRRWNEEHAKLKQLARTLQQTAANNDALASAYRAARTRLSRFEEAGPPQRPPKAQNVRIRLRGGRTGKRAVVCEDLELTGLMRPFDAEIWYGERVGVLGSCSCWNRPGTARCPRSGTAVRSGCGRGWRPAGSCRPTPSRSYLAAARSNWS